MAIKINGTEVIDDSRNIVNVGNIDGRDVSVDGSKLDGIESNADVTDSDNVGSALTGLTTETSIAGTDLIPVYDASASSWRKATVSDAALIGSKGQKGEVGAAGTNGLNGAKGQKGQTGITGAKGQKGEIGDQGIQGNVGSKGQKGELGLTGGTGLTGNDGAKGQKGEVGGQGLVGAKGQKGQAGADGTNGLNGATGLTGDTGQKGQKGEVGATGDTGSKGQKGEIGDTGQKGEIGAKGQKGEVGSQGIQGIQGIQGVKGQKGEIGATGLTGDGGAKGEKGQTGATGLTGAQGQKGQKGQTGNTGLTGTTGAKGEKGQKGEVGATGLTGAKGEKGQAGSNGTNGAKGQKGEIGATGNTGAPGVTGVKGQKGQKGEIGTTGNTGGTGPKGQKGEIGQTGGTGAKGQKGEKGQKGDNGTAGGTGQKGEKGQKGEIGAAGAKGSTGGTGAQGQKGQKGQTGATGTTGATGATGGTGAKGQKGDEAGNAGLLDGYDSSRFMRRQNKNNATVGPGWMTVASSLSSRHHGEVVVTDADSGDHAFIRIDFMRSYGDANFTVINTGGHANRITGARVLYQSSDNTYGWKYLQVYVTTSSNFEVNIYELGDIADYGVPSGVTPVIENTKSGYAVHGNAVLNLDTYSLTAEEGVQSGGHMRFGGSLYAGSTQIVNNLGQWVGSDSGIKGQKGEIGATGAKGQKGETGATGQKGQKGEFGVTTWTPSLSTVTQPSPNGFLKTSSNSVWNGRVYSLESYPNAYMSMRVGHVSYNYVMAGLTADPTASTSYNTIDYVWYAANGTWNIYENGTSRGGFGAVATSDVAEITYDGDGTVRYYLNGVLSRSIAKTHGTSSLHMSSSLYSTNHLTYLNFGPMGAQGSTGAKGQKGQTGGTGATGQKGQKGEIGATGAAGGTGAKGQKGESAVTATSVTFGSGVTLQESTDRADLLQITSSTSGWGGLQIRNSSNEGRWSFMTDGATAGFYDDENGDWALQMTENGGVTLYHNGVANFTTGATFLEMAKALDMNNIDIFGVDQIIHHGDTNTYMQFHAEDQWRVVTGGIERLEVNNSQITSTEPIHAPSFHGDGSSLTGISASAKNDIFWENGQAVSSSYTITNGKNAMSAGPITINSGVTVTVGAGETWTVI